MKTKIIGIMVGLLVLVGGGIFFNKTTNSFHAKQKTASTLVVCKTTSPYGFDIAQYTDGATIGIAAPIYNQLLTFKPSSTELTANLATAWVISKNELAYTLSLRKGVKFQTTDYFKPTRDFNADDVLFTFERIRNPKHPFNVAYPAEFPGLASAFLSLKKIEKIDNYTVRFILKERFAPFLQNLAVAQASLLSAEYANQLLLEGKVAQINQKPIGTGPFILKQYTKDQKISFVANRQYWNKSDEGQVKLDSLVMVVVPQSTSHALKMKAGECHLGNPPFSELAKFKKNPDFIVKENIPGFRVSILAYNTQKPALNKLAVRQALDMALNKEVLVKLYHGTSKLATSFLPPNQWSFDPSLKNLPYDPVKAKQLLKKAGYPNGFTLKLFVVLGSSVENDALAQMIQSDWKKIGVKAEFVTYEPGEFWRHAQKGEHDALFVVWGGTNGDPDDWVSIFECSAMSSANYSRWCYKPFNDLIVKGRQVANQSERIKIYQQAQQILNQQLPMTLLFNTTGTSVYSKKIKVLSKRMPIMGEFALGAIQYTGITMEQ